MSLRGASRAAASAALLWLAWSLAGGSEVLAALAAVDPAWFAAAVLLSVPMQLLSAARWCLTSRRIGLALGYLRALADYYLASLLNMLLPGGVGGDAARVWRHGRDRDGAPRYRLALHAVMLERGAGQCALLLVLAAGIAANWQRHPLAPQAGAALALLAAAGAAAWLAARATRAAGVLDALAGDAARAFRPARVLLAQAALSLAVVAAYLAAFWCAARAVHAPLEPRVALLAFPLVLTAMTLPVSVGGLGLREASAAAIWPALGLGAADGAASALVYGAAMLAGSLPGAGVPLLRGRARG